MKMAGSSYANLLHLEFFLVKISDYICRVNLLRDPHFDSF
jgi:hypothetical protein